MSTGTNLATSIFSQHLLFPSLYKDDRRQIVLTGGAELETSLMLQLLPDAIFWEFEVEHSDLTI